MSLLDPAEPRNNCPYIDEQLGLLKDQINAWEEVRERFVALREWGQWWESRAKELEEEIEEINKKLSEAMESLQFTSIEGD